MSDAEIWCLFGLPEEGAHIKVGSVTPNLLVPLPRYRFCEPEQLRAKSPPIACFSGCLALLVSLVANNADSVFSPGPRSAPYPAMCAMVGNPRYVEMDPDLWALAPNFLSQSIFKDMLHERSPAGHHLGRYAMVSRNFELFHFWLSCCQKASRMQSNNTSPFLGLNTSDFHFALKHGFIEELSAMIKFTGAELPLDALIKQSGIQEEKKPKYYQGLSIGGKKMTNWARERGGSYPNTMGESTPPLLQAAHQGGLAAVEWFLSDTPFRLYKEYGTNNASDPRLKTLAKAHGGLDQVFSTWLKQRSQSAQLLHTQY